MWGRAQTLTGVGHVKNKIASKFSNLIFCPLCTTNSSISWFWTTKKKGLYCYYYYFLILSTKGHISITLNIFNKVSTKEHFLKYQFE